MKPRSEQECTLVYDPDTASWWCWTDMPAIAAKWRRLAWPVAVYGTVDGLPRSWEATVPLDKVTFMRVPKKSAGGV